MSVGKLRDKNYYKKRDLLAIRENIVGKHVKHDGLDDLQNMYLTPFHIKLGLKENFVLTNEVKAFNI